MMIDYDPNDPSPQTIHALMNADGAMRAPVYGKFSLNPTIKNIHKITKEKYIRKGQVLLPDLSLYDFGKLNIYATGTAQTHVGDLSVDYVIEFHTPQVNTSDPLN